ncbi:MAG: PD-(D/E)XK nuclease family protein [bacterium]|nr:PD-(D/E)XK nuclease family protein [bacterium]
MTIYSHSRLSSFEKCPKQFEYRYIQAIPAEREGVEAFMGKRVHEVLERLYEFTARGQIPTLQQVIFRYQAFWDEHYDDKRVAIVRKGTPVSFYRNLGVRCLEYYYRRFHPFDESETLGVEEEVTFDLDAKGDYSMRGVVDRIVRGEDGAIEIHDYKTGRYIPSQKELNNDRQLALYQLGLRERFGHDQPYRLVWHYLQKRELRTSARTPAQLETLRDDTIAVIDKIEAATTYPNKRNRLCDWCEYKDRCLAEHP